ncbi:hypothetical protein ACU4GD_11950 [Cupriavidus basilensis]
MTALRDTEGLAAQRYDARPGTSVPDPPGPACLRARWRQADHRQRQAGVGPRNRQQAPRLQAAAKAQAPALVAA